MNGNAEKHQYIRDFTILYRMIPIFSRRFGRYSTAKLNSEEAGGKVANC